jgi:ribosomal protein L30E
MSLPKLREALKSKKIFFGTRQTIRQLKRGNLKMVFLSHDCNPSTKKGVEHYASLEKVEIVRMEQGSKEIAQLCKKNYPVSVLSTS